MIHIVMPFSRNFLIKQIKNNYRDKDIILHPIQHEDIDWAEDWIQPLFYVDNKPFDVCYDKLNFFKNVFPIILEDYYWVTGDDDLIEPEAIEGIKKFDYDVICVSLKRGDDVPVIGSICGTGILYAVPSNMRLWYTGLAQIIMKGKIFKETMYKENTTIGDGEMAVLVKNNYDVHYEPELFVRHNYYQPGRWERLGDKEFYEGI